MARQAQLALLSTLLRHAEQQLNRWVSQSSSAQKELTALEGHAMRIEVADTNLELVLRVVDAALRLSGREDTAAADIVIRAAAFDLLELLRAQSVSDLSGGAIEFRGSLAVADRFSRMLKLARPQLEDELAGWIGGVPARAVAQSADAALGWSTQASRSLALDVAEFLQSESRMLPLPHEVADLGLAIEQLRDEVERIEQRIERLLARERT